MKNIKLIEKKFVRLSLIVFLIPLQSCSNTLIGEKLENSFDTTENSKISINTNKSKDQNKIKSSIIDDDKENEDIKENITKEMSVSKKERSSNKSVKSIRKVIFNPQPYRIILKLSRANPSAPAETVTNALRKAGIQFEVEKIERFDEESLLKDSTLKRKEF